MQVSSWQIHGYNVPLESGRELGVSGDNFQASQSWKAAKANSTGVIN
jgi:hypothetical protein